MKILNRNDIRAAEQNAVSNGIFSFADLMKNAGEAAAKLISERYNITAKKVLVVCGKGNNGGDGIVIANRLSDLGAYVTVCFPLGIPDKYPASEYAGEIMLDTVKNVEGEYDFVIDALFGIGFKEKPDDSVRYAIERMNLLSGVKIAVDVPSGIDCDGISEPVCAVRADYTVTFIAPKPCFYLPLTAEYCGDFDVAQIGIAPVCYTYLTVPTPEKSKRRKFANKGDFGKALILCGNYGMCGAEIMASLAALRSGAGLVKAFVNERNYTAFCTSVFEAVSIPAKCDAYGCMQIGDEQLREQLLSCDAFLIGCGLGDSLSAEFLIKRALMTVENIPTVIDADGINTVAKDINIIRKIKAPVIITPHFKEMSRLCHTTVKSIEQNPVKYASEFSKQNSCIVVLKGANTVIASPDGRIFFNTTGNPGMATGGSGDVLAGITVSFLAQGISPLQSALSAVYYHGLAGDKALELSNERSLIPRDIIEELKTVL